MQNKKIQSFNLIILFLLNFRPEDDQKQIEIYCQKIFANWFVIFKIY